VTADLLRLLNELDAAREKATPGPWFVYWESRIDTQGPPLCKGQVTLTRSVAPPVDAALIVAAVNALPKLTAALRAVLVLCEEEDAESEPAYGPMWVGDVRDAIAAALAREALS
jgi:hypothetical protein